MSEGTNVAGHLFETESLDCWCSRPLQNGDACRMTRGTLYLVTPECVDQEGWAHYGKLNGSEYQETDKARTAHKAHCEHVMEALRGVCTA